MRTWNPLWTDLSDLDPHHSDAMHHMILASINWVETHGDISDLQWQERDLRSTTASEIIFSPWSEFFRPINDVTKAWFEFITAAGDKYSPPSASMMKQAMFSGLYVGMNGFDAFNLLMCEPPSRAIH